MRDIKFMAWNKTLGEMRDICSMEFDDTGRNEIIKIWDHPCTKTAKIKTLIASWFKEDCEIMQYTGLKDKNGKEIYEGDVVDVLIERDEIRRCIVEYFFSGFSLYGNAKLRHFSDLDEYEVIGNIYENLDLLK